MAGKYVCFGVGKGYYGIPVDRVVRIIRREEITSVPSAPRFVEGVINLRAEVIPVVNLRARFGLPRETEKKNRIVIIGAQNRHYGLLVDEVRDIVELTEEVIDREASAAVGISDEFITGIARIDRGLIVLLDIPRIITSAREINVQA